eukprot:g61440.t1
MKLSEIGYTKVAAHSDWNASMVDFKLWLSNLKLKVSLDASFFSPLVPVFVPSLRFPFCLVHHGVSFSSSFSCSFRLPV